MALQVADDRQIQEKQRIAPGLVHTAQTAADLRTDRGMSAAVHQNVEDGQEAIPVHVAHERVPPGGQDRRDVKMLVDHEKIEGQGSEQIDDLAGIEPVADGRPARQERHHRVLDLRPDVPDVAVLLQVVEQEDQCPELCGGSEALQVRFDDFGGVPGARHQFQQHSLHAQHHRELPPSQVFGALEIAGGELEAPALAALIGGSEESDGLQVQDTLVVRCAPPRLGQGLLGAAVRIAGIVKRGQLQPRVRIIGETGRHLLQDAADPGLDVPASAQLIENEAVAFAIVRIGLEARQHQVNEQHPAVAGLSAQQPRERLHHPARQELRLDGLLPDSSQGLQHACAGQRLVLGPGELDRKAVEKGGRRGRIPEIE